MSSYKLSASCNAGALDLTWSTPPDTASPNDRTSWLTSSSRGHRCRIARKIISRIQPTQTGRHPSSSRVRLNCTKSC